MEEGVFPGRYRLYKTRFGILSCYRNPPVRLISSLLRVTGSRRCLACGFIAPQEGHRQMGLGNW